MTKTSVQRSALSVKFYTLHAGRYMLYLLPFVFLFAGCEQQHLITSGTGSGANRLLLSVDFEPNTPLTYKFVSERQISLDLSPAESEQSSKGRKGKNSVRNMSEKLEMEIVYRPIEVDPYGLTVIEATCLSAKVTRAGISRRIRGRPDAVQAAAGRSWTLALTPAGEITDYSSFEKLTEELGEKAFAASHKGRVKDPDMIMDFIAMQRHIWDSIATIKEPLKGVRKGQKWDSKLLAPMPFVSKTGRDVEYRFAGIVESDNVSYAEITSSYELSRTPPEDITMPYSGSFSMRGTFGFLRSYRVQSIEGSGRQLYDINRGLIKSDVQHYNVKAVAAIFGLGDGSMEPSIEIDQTITMTME